MGRRKILRPMFFTCLPPLQSPAPPEAKAGPAAFPPAQCRKSPPAQKHRLIMIRCTQVAENSFAYKAQAAIFGASNLPTR